VSDINHQPLQTTARVVNLDNRRRTLNDRIGKGDRQDFIRFQVRGSSQFTARLSGLQANANLTLLDGKRQVLQTSTRKGKQSERIQHTLAPGTYYLQVSPGGRRATTRYRLTMDSTPMAASPPAGSTSGNSASNGKFDIQFDYRFDTNGWFTPEKRAALEAAADIWENIILNDFPDIAAGRRSKAVNPQTGVLSDYVSNGVDDLVIAVGARKASVGVSGFFTTLAVAEPGNWLTEQAHNTFASWVGSVSFNPTVNWFFDATPSTATDIPKDQTDFISTATHEIGHILGFSRSPAFMSLSGGYVFQGAAAKARNGGLPVDLTNTYHLEQNTQLDGSGDPLMSTYTKVGQRKLPTALDIAVLNDTGYTVNYGGAFRNPVS
jgi:hypothetical protein